MSDHWVYRAYGDGLLLYVGVTSSPKQRVRQHKVLSSWWPLVDRFKQEGPMTDVEAYAAEKAAIATEGPEFNRSSGSRAPSRPTGLAGLNQTFRMNSSELESVDRLAEAEQRTRSQMLRLLIEAGLKAREAQR